MPELFVTRLAWEWFQADGPKTLARLEEIARRQAEVYAYDVGTTDVVLEEARQKFAARYGREA